MSAKVVLRVSGSTKGLGPSSGMVRIATPTRSECGINRLILQVHSNLKGWSLCKNRPTPFHPMILEALLDECGRDSHPQKEKITLIWAKPGLRHQISHLNLRFIGFFWLWHLSPRYDPSPIPQPTTRSNAKDQVRFFSWKAQVALISRFPVRMEAWQSHDELTWRMLKENSTSPTTVIHNWKAKFLCNWI